MPLPAFAYRAGQAVLAPGASGTLRTTLRSWSAGHEPGGLVLDVGCGPRSWLDALGVQPVGVDRRHPTVRAFRRRSGTGVVGSATALPFRTGAFDSAWCFGLLHHLPDESVLGALRELQRVTRRAGHAVVFDGVRPGPNGGRLARLVRRVDRGRWIRSRHELDTLLDRAGPWCREAVRYSAVGLEGVLATWTSP